MPVQWCVHPVYHSGKTKVGPKPSHPRGTRRVDDKLVKFINDTHGILLDSTAESIKEGDLLCRTCYEEESRRLNLHNISLTNMEEEYGQMNIDDNTAKRRCTRALIFTESSDEDFLFDKSGESSFLQTSMEKSEEFDGMEEEFRQSKAKALLNEVFLLLDLPKVSDW